MMIITTDFIIFIYFTVLLFALTQAYVQWMHSNWPTPAITNHMFSFRCLTISLSLSLALAPLSGSNVWIQNSLNLSNSIFTDLSLRANEWPTELFCDGSTELFCDGFCPTDILSSFHANRHESVAQVTKPFVCDWSTECPPWNGVVDWLDETHASESHWHGGPRPPPGCHTRCRTLVAIDWLIHQLTVFGVTCIRGYVYSVTLDNWPHALIGGATRSRWGCPRVVLGTHCLSPSWKN